MFSDENTNSPVKDKDKDQQLEVKDNSCSGNSSSTHCKYKVLKNDYIKFRAKSKNTYDFYNIVEKAVLEMEGEESNRINED